MRCGRTRRNFGVQKNDSGYRGNEDQTTSESKKGELEGVGVKVTDLHNRDDVNRCREEVNC